MPTSTDLLRFDTQNYTIKMHTIGQRAIVYRAYTDLAYCTHPQDEIQKLDYYVPDAYFRGGTIHGYTLHTAPIFAPNFVGGYLPGARTAPGLMPRGEPNSVFEALYHGYAVVTAGLRGRTSGTSGSEYFAGSTMGDAVPPAAPPAQAVGKAPALVVDMKAVVRYLRHNRDVLPGDTERIITNGTSAGGALSALMGATGNEADYNSALAAIGAAEERDDVFAASCYCPIHNLENADAAYEWMYAPCTDYSWPRFRKENGKRIVDVRQGPLTPAQLACSAELKRQFPAYLNSLALRDAAGAPLTLAADGSGPFRERVCQAVLDAAAQELATHETATQNPTLMVPGSEVEQQSWLTFKNGRLTGLDWEGYLHAVRRMKTPPAFDALDLSSPENEEFGTPEFPRRHFTAYGLAHSTVGGTMAEERIIKMLNPLCYLAKTPACRNWRIRHGTHDRDTSLAIPIILADTLRACGCQVDFALPWGLPHSGDYDLASLFAWIDSLCAR